MNDCIELTVIIYSKKKALITKEEMQKQQKASQPQTTLSSHAVNIIPSLIPDCNQNPAMLPSSRFIRQATLYFGEMYNRPNPFRSCLAFRESVETIIIQYEKSSPLKLNLKNYGTTMSELKMFVNTKQQFCKSLSVKKG